MNNIDNQLKEVKNNNGKEFYEAIKSVVMTVDDVNDERAEIQGLMLPEELEQSDDNIIQDENFYSVVEYLSEVTADDIKSNFGRYGYNSLYIDNDGRGLLVLEW